MPPPKNSLDHLILFLPADNTNLPILSNVFTSNFTITPGGTHADGLTANSLIILSDGCYIETICFIPSSPPEKIYSHWWGPDVNRKGWADWCLTNSLSPEANHEEVQETHAEPIKGARKRADGVEVKWAVTFPKGEYGGQASRGKVPFFCHDVTPRDFRVPVSETSTKHACGALGVRELTVIAKDQEGLDEVRKVYASLFGNEGIAKGDEVIFKAGRVNSVDGLDGGASIVLRLPRSGPEAWKARSGFWHGDVVLAAKANEGKEAGTRERLDADGDHVHGLWVEYV